MCKCESCAKTSNDIRNRYDAPHFAEEYGMVLCGACEKRLDDGVEEHEERRRLALALAAEY